MYKQDLKQLVCQEIDKLEPVLSKLADYLHQHPEISMQEIKAVNYLKKLLEEFQFIFTPILKDTFSTAFIATKGNGDKKIGFLAEYDALPDIVEEYMEKTFPAGSNHSPLPPSCIPGYSESHASPG